VTGDPAVCRCGHPADSHEHYRDGSDCSTCRCGAFRPADEQRPSKSLAVAAGLAAVPVLVLAALAANTYLGGWATALLLGLVAAAGVWLIIRPEREEDR